MFPAQPGTSSPSSRLKHSRSPMQSVSSSQSPYLVEKQQVIKSMIEMWKWIKRKAIMLGTLINNCLPRIFHTCPGLDHFQHHEVRNIQHRTSTHKCLHHPTRYYPPPNSQERVRRRVVGSKSALVHSHHHCHSLLDYYFCVYYEL